MLQKEVSLSTCLPAFREDLTNLEVDFHDVRGRHITRKDNLEIFGEFVTLHGIQIPGHT